MKFELTFLLLFRQEAYWHIDILLSQKLLDRCYGQKMFLHELGLVQEPSYNVHCVIFKGARTLLSISSLKHCTIGFDIVLKEKQMYNEKIDENGSDMIFQSVCHEGSVNLTNKKKAWSCPTSNRGGRIVGFLHTNRNPQL